MTRYLTTKRWIQTFLSTLVPNFPIKNCLQYSKKVWSAMIWIFKPIQETTKSKQLCRFTLSYCSPWKELRCALKKHAALALARYVFSKPPLLFIFLLLHTVLPTPPGARAAINNAAAGAATGRAWRWRRSGRRSNHLSKQTHKWVTNMRVNPQPHGNSICSNMQFFSMYNAVLSAAYFKHESPLCTAHN